MANTYSLGSKVRIAGSFAAANHSLVDPDAVTLSIKSPSGAMTVYSSPAFTRKSTGIYYMDFTPTAAGTWTYRWSSTGVGQAAAEGSFVVSPSSFA